MYSVEWDRVSMNIIKKNREGLGLSTRSLLIRLFWVINHLTIRDRIIYDGELILADGLIIGLTNELEVENND